MKIHDLTLVGPVGIRRFEALHICDSFEGHEHNYDHTTIVVSGRVSVQMWYLDGDKLVDGGVKEYGQGEYIPMAAKIRHTIKALADGPIWDCLFSHRDFNGLIVERYVGNKEACK